MSEIEGHRAAQMWARLEATAQANSSVAQPTAAATIDADNEAKKLEEKKRRRRVRRRLDACCWVFWPYVVLKIFVVDLDRKVLESTFKGSGRFVDYRSLVYLAVVIVLVATVKHTWKYLLYIAFFPFIAVFWKLPRAVYKRGSWLPIVGAVHVVSSLVESLRFNVVTKGLAVFAVIGATIPHTAVIVLPSCVYLVGLLAVSYFRATRKAFTRSRFLRQQDELLNWIYEKNPYDLGKLASELGGQDLELYPKAELDRFTTALNLRLAVNRSLYFWAYQLDQYRQTAASFAMNGLAYFGLFLASAAVVTAVNVGLLHTTAGQFTYQATPSVVRMTLYSVSSLALNAGGGIEAVGDGASAVRLFAGLLGCVFLVTFLATLTLSYRRERDDTALRETVTRLKERAADDERDLKDVWDVDVNEALRRLDRLGANLAGVVARLVASSLPPGFIDNGA